MDITSLAEIGLGLALVVWISYRQYTWRPVDPARMWRMPLILTGVGFVSLAGAGAHVVSATDLGLLALEALLSAAVGVAMGSLAVFRPAASAPGALETRTGWAGIVLWLAVIGMRVAFGFWAHSLGATLVESSGAIVLMIALNRLARVGVVVARMQRRTVSEIAAG